MVGRRAALALIRRHLLQRVERALATSRVVNIVGPRQAGKTTLVRDLLQAARYLTLDDRATREALETDPLGQLQLAEEQRDAGGGPLVIDEVQRLPELTLALKQLVDRDQRPGRFVLTGSSDVFTTAKAYDSLAGRVTTLTLRPLSAAEIMAAGGCRLLDLALESQEGLLSALPVPASYGRRDAIDLVARGGFPEIRPLDDAERIDRYLSYLDSVVERDAAAVSEIRKPDLLRRLIDQTAASSGEELNIARLCDALAARKETVSLYLDLLGRLGLIHRLGAWTSSEQRREIKAPKIHFMDTGCATALRGEDSTSFGFGADPDAFGHLLETFVFVELEKSLPLLARRWRLYHWRARDREIDIVAQAPGRRLALIETKAASSVDRQDFRHIDWFLAEGPGQAYEGAGFVVYLGNEILSFGPKRLALPLSTLWSFPPLQA